MPGKFISELLGEPIYYQAGLMSDPIVTFLCPTFGRAARQPHLINEMLYWYTRQTYKQKQLLIVNDAPGQRLFVSSELKEEYGVHVANLGIKIRSLGEKMNLMVMMAPGSICLVQEDDDISLPWRAEQAVAALHNHDYWTPGLWWYAEEGKPMVADGKGVGHNCAAYRRAAMYNRYPTVTQGHDMIADAWAKSSLRVNRRKLRNPEEVAEISYVYRWGVSDYHLSGISRDMEASYRDADPGPAGTYELCPVMGRDYLALHDEVVNAARAGA